MAFEAYLLQDRVRPKKGRRITYTVSLVFHGILLFAGAVYSFWHVDELSPPTVAVTFMAANPPPPPPPPPPRKKKTEQIKPKQPTEIVQPRPDQIVQPKEEPKPEPVEEDEGVEGGVEGGVPGGVVGGLVGAAPVKEEAPPKMLPPAVGRGLLITDTQANRVHLPGALNRSGMSFWALVKICVSVDGNVTDVKIMKGADPALDPLILENLRTWRYRPAMIDGRPVPFCTNVRYEIQSQ